MDGLYRTKDAATKLDISMGRVRQIRKQLQDQGVEVGRLIGRDLFFTDDDLARMRQRRTVAGRPQRERRQDDSQRR